MVLSMETRITLEKFCGDMRDIFKFDEDDEFTLKWLDEEGKSSKHMAAARHEISLPAFVNFINDTLLIA